MSDDTGGSRGRGNRLENLANVLTVLVALAAIGLSVWQGWQNRQFYRLSVLPNLEPIEASISSATPIDLEAFLLPGEADSLHAVGYALENSGLGPAVVENVLVWRRGEKTFDASTSGERFYLAAVDDDLAELPFWAGSYKDPVAAGEMLRAGQVHPLITVPIPFGSFYRDSVPRWPPDVVMEDVLETYSFVFCYCSVYETDCDEVHLGSEPPVEDACGFRGRSGL